jgi:AraC-like DNA-binding protein
MIYPIPKTDDPSTYPHDSKDAVPVDADWQDTAAPDSDQRLVRAAKQYLTHSLTQPPPPRALAEALGVSKKRLVTAFRLCIGVSMFEFVRQERMRKAQRMLAQTSLSVMTIAEEAGFSSAANFSKAFRDYAGMSPTAFRREAPLRQITALQGSLSWDSSDGKASS